MHRLTQHRHTATIHILASWHTTQLVREKGHGHRLGKSEKRYLKGYPDPTDECETPAGATPEPNRCRRIDHKSHTRRMERGRASPAGAD